MRHEPSLDTDAAAGAHSLAGLASLAKDTHTCDKSCSHTRREVPKAAARASQEGCPADGRSQRWLISHGVKGRSDGKR